MLSSTSSFGVSVGSKAAPGDPIPLLQTKVRSTYPLRSSDPKLKAKFKLQSGSKLLARHQFLEVLATFPFKTRFYRIAAIIHRFKVTQASNPLHYARIHHCR